MSIIKRTAAVCIALFLAVQTAICVYAEQATLNDLFEQSKTSRGADSFFDGLEFGQSDWTALCYIRLYGTDGAEEYLRSVKSSAAELMESDGFVRPTELQRASVILSAAGIADEKLLNAAVYQNENLARQGFNAYIWALIAANCADSTAPADAVNTEQSLTEYILSKQLEDGGFALKGNAADTDITAAVIYALAPRRDNAEVAAALDAAEKRLTLLQLENGGYMTVGVENCESAAQAIIAFTSLGYGAEDERISRALSAMMRYNRGDGFAHIPDGETSGVATMQATLALTALELHERGEVLYSAPESPAEIVIPEETETVTEVETKQTAADISENGISGQQIKYIISAVLAAAGIAVLVAFFARGRRNKALAAAGVVCLLCAGGVLFVDIRTPEEYYSENEDGVTVTVPAQRGEEITVTVSADCGNALLNMSDIEVSINPPEVIPEDGMMIYPAQVTLPEGGSAFDALLAAARRDRVQVDYSGTVYGAYISGIGHVYEFGFGPMSGWLYRVNGEFASESAGAYTLSDGDVVEFIYTCQQGDTEMP